MSNESARGNCMPLLFPKRRDVGANYKKFDALARRYGDKAAGISILPPAWTPPFVAIPVVIHNQWLTTGGVSLGSYADEIQLWFDGHGNASFLARSSGYGENLRDRGSLRTLKLAPGCSVNDLTSAISEIYAHASSACPSRTLGIVVQVEKVPDASGHLSNETALQPTRNQWKYEAEYPVWGPPQGLNTKFAPDPDPLLPIQGKGPYPHEAMRTLGNWINKAVTPRSHIEWVFSEGRLWAVQLDLEWRQKDEGIDPRATLQAVGSLTPNPSSAHVFKLHSLGEPTKSKKLANLCDFDFSDSNPPPSLFHATAERIASELGSSRQEPLVSEIDDLTAGRCVIRTDLLGNAKAFNLPRTDTINGPQAVGWLAEQIQRFSTQGVALDEVMFVLHSFIPALSAAWVYAQPGDPIVLVDSLWGLPDGLQFLPHDSHQVDAVRGRMLSEKIRYKPRFLKEEEGGVWKYVDVRVAKGRQRSLARKDVIEIAQRTAKIAERIEAAAQVMWFCGVPSTYGIGPNIPWFRARDFADPPPRQQIKHKPVDIRSVEDLSRLGHGPHTLCLMPGAPLVRDDAFLDAVIAQAKASRSAVALQGSLLGHTFYKLSNAGLPVILHDPVQHYRKRGKKTFGKIVRDKIPQGIKSKGELVREAILVPQDIIAGLAAKLCEESVELLQASGASERLEELSDLNELLAALRDVSGVSVTELEATVEKKRQKKGGFQERRILLETSLPMPGLSRESIPEVRLSEIAHAVTHRNAIFIPFAALFANASGLVVDLDEAMKEATLRVKVVAGGIRIEFIDKAYSPPRREQLDMFELSPTEKKVSKR